MGVKWILQHKSFFGFKKYDNEAVSYNNLCETWERGDKVKLAAYAMIDTLLTKDLIVIKKLNGFHLTLGEIIGLPESEIYLNGSVRRLVSLADRLGYKENLLTPDTSMVRNDRYPWIPACPWNTRCDNIHLRPPGGSTVPDVFGVYFMLCAMLDFKSQYPSIMAGYNICLTSMIELEDISKLYRLVEDKDYIQITLENVQPLVKHMCLGHGKPCQGTVQDKGDPMKCKFGVEYVVVKHHAYFVTENYYKSVLNRSFRDMAAACTMYK